MNKFIQVRLSVENVADVANAYADLKKNSPNLVGVVKGRTIGPVLGEWDVFYKRLENAVQSTVPGMARGVFGEVGVLSNQDIENYKKLLPTAKTDPHVAEQILQDITQKTNRAVSLFVDTYTRAGYNVGELSEAKARADSAVASLGAAPAQSGSKIYNVGGKKLQRVNGVIVVVP
jgi:hypothetical protein